MTTKDDKYWMNFMYHINSIIQEFTELDTKAHIGFPTKQFTPQHNFDDSILCLVQIVYEILVYCQKALQYTNSKSSFDKHKDKEMNKFCASCFQKQCIIFRDEHDPFIASFTRITSECIIILKDHVSSQKRKQTNSAALLRDHDFRTEIEKQGNRITYYEGSKWFSDYSDFLEKFPPSETSNRHCSWIAVHKRTAKSYDADITRMMQEWQSIINSKKQITPQVIFELGKKYFCLSGKWLLFPQTKDVDRVWSTICQATVEGKLGHYAKVAPRGGGHTHTICVYSIDFTDEKDVYRVRQVLNDLGFTGKLSYKPDVYTYCGIYGNNQWKINPNIYSK